MCPFGQVWGLRVGGSYVTPCMEPWGAEALLEFLGPVKEVWERCGHRGERVVVRATQGLREPLSVLPHPSGTKRAGRFL